MDTECTIHISPEINIQNIYRHLREHVIMYSPPYNLHQILVQYISRSNGRPIRVVISHPSRNIHIVESSLQHQILQTAINGFVSHRIHRASFRPFQSPLQTLTHRQPPPPAKAVETQHTCSICLEKIMQHDLQLLPCAHSFHRHCCARWFRTSLTCPECRLPMA